jgi:hypothetical protein
MACCRMNARTRHRQGVAWLLLVGSLLLPTESRAQGPTPDPFGEPFPAPSGSAPARTDANGPKLTGLVYTGAHFAGRQRQSGDLGTTRRGLGPALTLGARLEVATSRYLSIGGFVDYLRLAYEVVRPAPVLVRREERGIVSLGVWVKGSIPFTIEGQEASVYLGVPVGLSMALSSQDETTFGLLGGALGGAHLMVTDAVGVFLEAGVRADRYTLEDDRGVHERMSFIQGVLRGGVSFEF